MFNFGQSINIILEFLDLGGNVLLIIMFATFVMWVLILERLFYFFMSSKTTINNVVNYWDSRKEHKSWYALAIREKLISEVNVASERNMILIKAIIATAPLLGLLGTVTGMIEVFDVMAATGSSNARLMAAGISKATIPTMSGLVASLSGILLANYIGKRIESSVAHISDKLLIE